MRRQQILGNSSLIIPASLVARVGAEAALHRRSPKVDGVVPKAIILSNIIVTILVQLKAIGLPSFITRGG